MNHMCGEMKWGVNLEWYLLLVKYSSLKVRLRVQQKRKNHLRARDFWQINNFGKDRKQWENNRKRKVVCESVSGKEIWQEKE